MILLAIATAAALQAGVDPPIPPIAGCSMLRVTVDSARHVTVAPERQRRACGALRILADSSAGYDATQGVVTLRLVVENGWSRSLIAPVMLFAWPDSITPLPLHGLMPTADRGSITLQEPDRPAGANATPYPGALAWKLVAPSGRSAVPLLAPAQRTRARSIGIAIPRTGELSFVFVLRAEAARAVVFPQDPPVRTASDFLPGAAIAEDVAWLPPGRVVADVVELRFYPGTSLADRQARLDALRGTVIGVTAPSGADERTYFVRLPPDSTEPPIAVVADRRRNPSGMQDLRAINIDSLVGPEQRRSPLFLSPVAGCATMRVRFTGGAGLAVDSVATGGCGPIVPVIRPGSTFDPRTRVVRLHVALVNRWTREVITPLRLFAWNDSIRVTPLLPAPATIDRRPPLAPRPPGAPPRPPRPPPPPPAPKPPWLREPDPRVRWADADSAIGGGAALLPKAQLWRYSVGDSRMGSARQLPAGGSTTERVISLKLDTARVEEFTVRLTALAENAHYVPPIAPAAGDPVGAFDHARWLTVRSEFGGAPVVGDLIDVTFSRWSPQLARQAPVDSIRGEVVGGERWFGNGDGTYVVRIPFDPSGRTLVTALALLRRQQVVDLAMPVNAEGGSVRYSSIYVTPLVRGCATIRVELKADRVSAAAVPSPYCGPVIPVLAGAATLDAATGRIRLPIALENGWAIDVMAPMELYAWNDSMSVLVPGGVSKAPSGRVIELEPSTAEGWRDDGTLHTGPRWSFDSLVAPRADLARLAPGARSPSQVIQLNVHAKGPLTFEVRLRVETRNAHPVPPSPPNGDPAWVYADSALDDGRVSKHALNVAFRYGVSREARQAAIDSVRGRVIGGSTDLGWYLVEIPTDGTRQNVERAEKILTSMPQVEFALPVLRMEVR